jgi:hypothetical protein
MAAFGRKDRYREIAERPLAAPAQGYTDDPTRERDSGRMVGVSDCPTCHLLGPTSGISPSRPARDSLNFFVDVSKAPRSRS